ncbi:hypothetical protein BUALT_Bualt03G0110100 [Buddleja alternifolia]|uniref:Zinc finger PHD-type domain-containing protein n=1 Tax=Buddleja alternifolia TaxID=168488 RepID=A0AAV6XTY2_9LAMI|nr:hypothetical protein BUALT_Bualt03G0110100 [Buddleja alternifolia]
MRSCMRSTLLSTFLEEKPRKRKASDEDVKPSFIVDDVNENEDQESDNTNGSGDDHEEEEEDDCFDSVCAICDNGGHLYISTIKMDLQVLELGEIKHIDFYCKNCEYKQHQCFACGKLGSSDESSGAEVFCCVNGACGHFYHPECVAKLLNPGNGAAAEEHRKKIASGEQFACPVHKCHACKELEVRSIPELQFAICRRCPRAYHIKCLPREIAFEEDVDEENNIIQRAWKGLIPNRVLIYCLKHEIDPEILTPVRGHIKFPGPQPTNRRRLPIESSKRKDLSKDRVLDLEDSSGKRVSVKPLKGVEKVSFSSKQGDLSRKRAEKLLAQGTSRKQSLAPSKYSLVKSKKSPTDNDNLYASVYGTDPEPEKYSRGGSLRDEQERTQKAKPTTKRVDNSITLDADARKRIWDFMNDASSSITLDQVRKRHKAPSTHTQYTKFSADNITFGKVEGSVQALRAALRKLNEGGSVQDAKSVCGNELFGQVMRWKDKLKVYLAPFLYGMRYTSFGRHFTQMDKLKEIVDMLHCYTQDGDTIVDFCCGSNDFSCLMKKKLDEMGKTCSYKNYDILQPKNDFNFEKRDWMKVRRDELPEGSRLIMGLNPPFGVNGGLANKFIDKALEFKPKLLILIVPRETQRLDEKKPPYDLIWEDDQMCSGKSFYLPGSVDVNDKQIEDWNVNAPILYLWSNPDWTSKHKAIAEQRGHLSGSQKKYKLEENHDYKKVLNSSHECHNFLNEPLLNQGEEDTYPVKQEKQEEEAKVVKNHQEVVPHGRTDTKGGNNNNKNHAQSKNHSKANSSKSGGKKKRKRQSDNVDKSAGNKRSGSRHPSPKVVDHRSSIERPSTYRPYSGTKYNRDRDQVDDLVRMYTLNNDEPSPSMISRQVAYTPSPNPDFGFGASAEQWMGSPEERVNSFAYNIPGRTVTPPCHPRPGFPSPYGQLTPAANPSYVGMNTSAMQRYAPRLDELQHGRMNDMVPAPPVGGIYQHPGPRPPFHQMGSLGFAPGPYRPYSQQNSSGWLNE